MRASVAGRRIGYGPGSLRFGDLRLPGGEGLVPVVVVIHGGCWLTEYDIEHISPAAEALTDNGFATWTVEYRRLGDPGGGWPGTFHDIAAAVDHVRTLATDVPRLDLTRVVLCGHSAGGHLALWAASRRPEVTTELSGSGTAPLAVAGVVSLAGITNLAAYGAARGSCNRSVRPLLGGTAVEQPDRYHIASPIELVPVGVPIRLVHGEADRTVRINQSRAFLSRARAAGDDVELEAVPRAGHFDVIEPGTAAWTVVLGAVRSVSAAGRPPMS